LKSLFIIVIFLVTLTLHGQEFNLKHDHTNILVSNLEVSGNFYKDILQLKELETPWGENPGVRFFSIGDGRQIHLAKVDPGTIVSNKVTHIAFNVTEFDRYLNFLNEKQIPYSDFQGNVSQINNRPDGVRQIYFQDPDGNWIEINDAYF